VLEAIKLANQMNAVTIGLTGFDGGQLSQMVKINVHVPSDCIEQVEDLHLMLQHLICTALRQLTHKTTSSRDERLPALKEISPKVVDWRGKRGGVSS
jgi:DNA-binding MurR/RpiR family transcriptional regulator